MHLQKMGVKIGKNCCGGLTPVHSHAPTQLLLCCFLHIGVGERTGKTEVKMVVGQDEGSSIAAGKVRGKELIQGSHSPFPMILRQCVSNGYFGNQKTAFICYTHCFC